MCALVEGGQREVARPVCGAVVVGELWGDEGAVLQGQSVELYHQIVDQSLCLRKGRDRPSYPN